MRKLIAVLTIIMCAGAVAPAADARSAKADKGPQPYLSVTEAKEAVGSYIASTMLLPFGEVVMPYVSVRCHKIARSTARCNAQFSTDRLKGSVRAKVREDAPSGRGDEGSYLLWMSHLRTSDGDGEA